MSSFFTSVDVDGMFIGICLEGFLYGKISVLCVPLSNEVQLLFPGLLELYSRIFAMYSRWLRIIAFIWKRTILRKHLSVLKKQ
jgi:hypothetical protein